MYGLLAIPLITVASLYLGPNRRWVTLLAAIGSGLTCLEALILAGGVFAKGPYRDGFFFVDALGALLLGSIAVVGLLGLIYSAGYFRQGESMPLGRWRAYHTWYQLFVATMLLVVIVNNVGVMWAALEATTLVSAMLVGFSGSRGALEASWKYIVICTVGITLALFGVILTYYASFRLTPSLDWTVLMKEAPSLNPGLLHLAFIFILVGFGTKVGLAPMHTWLPDAHSQAPSPVSALLSGVLLPCALYGAVRFHLILAAGPGGEFSSHLFIFFGLLSMGVAVPFILLQGELKRLLAYSSLEHMGIITFALGLESRLAFYGVALQLVSHALAKSLLFFCAGNITEKYGSQKLPKINGILVSLPWTGPLFLILVLAIAGMPPFGLFLGEVTIIEAGLATGRFWPTVIFLGLLAIIFTGLLYYAGRAAFGKGAHAQPGEPIPWFPYLSLLPLLGLVFLGLGFPGPVENGLWQVATVLGGGVS